VIPAVVDTDIVSYIFKNVPGAGHYRKQLADWELVISFMSVAELRAGVLIAGWGWRRTAELEGYIRRFRVVYPDNAMCSLWAEVRAQRRHRGHEIGAQDAWVAATALALDAPLATNNRRDYEHIPGIELLAL
jgi:tRNA(fMet)-specific endonuclease VapC